VFDFANKAPLLMGQIYRKIHTLEQIIQGMIKSAMFKLKPEWVFPLFIAVILSLYFYYIDEGKYNFTGIFEFTNLFFLAVYIFILLGIQMLIQLGLGRFGLTRNKSLLVQSVVSAFLLFALLFMFFIIIS
jgi:hypothetical protein